MKRFLLLAAKTVFLCVTISASFGLLLMRKVALFIANHYRMITGTDPMGARQIVQGSMGAVTWFVGMIRSFIARYVRSYHPKTWRKLRDYLKARR